MPIKNGETKHERRTEISVSAVIAANRNVTSSFLNFLPVFCSQISIAD